MSQSNPPTQLSVQQAVDQVVTHGRKLAADRLDLAIMQAQQTITAMGNRVLDVVFALLLGLCGFVLLTVAAVLHLAEPLGTANASLAVGVLDLVGAGVLVLLSRRRLPSVRES